MVMKMSACRSAVVEWRIISSEEMSSDPGRVIYLDNEIHKKNNRSSSRHTTVSIKLRPSRNVEK